MMVRAAEIRESEQQQIFDTLDEIHARLQPLDSLGSMRKRMSDLPDRNEVSVLAERLDETVAKLESNDLAVASLARAVDAIVDKLAKPFAQLDGRLDGVAGRFEGVAGRMNGLEDKLAHIHGRIDDLEGQLDKQSGTLEALPGQLHKQGERVDALSEQITTGVGGKLEELQGSVRGRIDEVEIGVREQLESFQEALSQSVADSRDHTATAVSHSTETLQQSSYDAFKTMHSKIDDSHELLHGRIEELRDAIESPQRTEEVLSRVDALAKGMQAVIARIGTVEKEVTALGGTVREGVTEMETAVSARPDNAAVAEMVRNANTESERRNAGQLDEAMATFAELILGSGGPSMKASPPLPRQQRRRNPSKSRTNGTAEPAEVGSDDS